MLNREQTALLVIDIQDILMPKAEAVVKNYLHQAERVVRMARILDLPILVTEQNPERLGSTNAGILDALGQTERMPKMEFGCLANDAFRRALQDTERKQLLIVGMETHVCVLQTGLDALAQGYEVYLVKDAIVSSRKYEYKAGLARLQQAGAHCATAEMAIFELLRKAGTSEFKQLLPVIKG
ncbi:MAG TPA: isochorismatase family protein [Candidatus Hydrogenedentes bacterium]|nr:isochorismatase family protein [Candidatus Hydrogenedentota bacterium]